VVEDRGVRDESRGESALALDEALSAPGSTSAQLIHDVGCFALRTGSDHDIGDVATENLLLGEAVEGFCRAIPTDDRSLGIGDEDRLPERLEQTILESDSVVLALSFLFV